MILLLLIYFLVLSLSLFVFDQFTSELGITNLLTSVIDFYFLSTIFIVMLLVSMGEVFLAHDILAELALHAKILTII